MVTKYLIATIVSIMLLVIPVACTTAQTPAGPASSSSSSSNVTSGPVPGSTPIVILFIADDFSGPLRWTKAVETAGPCSPPAPPASTGSIAAENKELSIRADYWWYNVWAYESFPVLSGDCHCHVRFAIQADDVGSHTNVWVALGSGDVLDPSNRTINFGWDGHNQRWSIMNGSNVVGTAAGSITKGQWTHLVIDKTGTTVRYRVNGSEIYRQTLAPFEVNFMAMGTGVDVHGEGGTHVHFADVLLKRLGI